MRIVAIMPTYGRPKLVASALWQFLKQDHPADQCRLLILDDLGQLSGRGPNWRVISTPTRFQSLLAKYQYLYWLLDNFWPEWEAVAIMEDDDVYGPQWLSSHAACLAEHRWSKPSQIYCTYGKDVLGGQPPFYETVQSVAGRFFASCAVRRDLMEQVGGFIDTTPQGQDLAQMAAWQQAAGPPGDTLQYATAQYCYAWGRANHASGLHDWNDFKSMDSTKDIELTPDKDDFGDRIYRVLWVPLSKWERRRRQSMCNVCSADKEDRCRRACNGSDFFAVWICPEQKWQPEVGILPHEDILAWMQRDPSAGRAELPEITRRNLIYHCYPTQANELWRWQAERIAKTANQFNGHRIIAIAVDDTTHDLTEVYKTFGKAFEFTPLSNDTRLRETASFKNLLQTVASTDAHEATFYGHSKGNSTTGNPIGAEFWARASYHVLLNDSKRINGVLRYWSACGLNIINLLGNRIYPTGLQHGEWLFSGTFFWFRHDRIFTVPNWDVVPDDRYGTEAWVSGLLKLKDVWTEYQAWSVKTYPTPSPYNPYSYIDEILD
jgi:hypothetical protein